VTTVGLNVQKPAIGVFEDIDAFMGNLPEQVVKIFLGFRSRDLLINRITTNRFRTFKAFLIEGYLYYFAVFFHFNHLNRIRIIHIPYP
jgi:hypothetical protein